MSDTNYNEEIDEATPATVAEWLVNVTAGDQMPCVLNCARHAKRIRFDGSPREAKWVRILCPACRAQYFAVMAGLAIADYEKLPKRRR